MAAETTFAEVLLLGWKSWLVNSALQGLDDLPKLSFRTFIGILMAVSGNVLISLALNLQKLAHKRVETERNDIKKGRSSEFSESIVNPPTPDERDEDQESNSRNDQDDIFTNRNTTAQRDAELQPLTSRMEPMAHDYGTGSSTPPSERPTTTPKRTFTSRFNPLRRKKPGAKFMLPVDVISEDAALHGLATLRKKPSSSEDSDSDAVDENEGEYLKSKLWWTGFLLMNIGETGNFISYAFAPASMVAPLGTFALMANCFFAPLLLREHFKKRDLLGVLIAVIGAITVVLASNASDTRLDMDALLKALRQTPFIVFSCIYVVGAVTLATLSEWEVGRKHVFVDVGLCALFGGFTVLSTKGISTLLTLEWMNIFTHWITYALLLVLLLTGIGQIRYLNRALMRFDSKVVIPVQFVFFTLSAIIGSAILYGDFKKARFHQVITFLYGCAATFAGVFIIAWSPKDRNDEFPLDEEQIEEDSDPITDPVQAGQEGARLGMGTLGRRQRATLVLPSGINPPTNSPVLGHKRSGVISTMGISPAQHLLLVHTPPRESSLRDRSDDDTGRERSLSVTNSPVESYSRRRTVSWYGHDTYRNRSGGATRNSSTVGRRRDDTGITRTESNPPGSVRR
ncbi:magnesium transporter NIPA-domain-containing protein [Crepidotus variabilis]|uniref:Magnesium transporter NIPA-domain-containing protein n=1 Tax=Crepidotus variabilis TaxID=179855 RepID=A0A9P6JWJ0_9AGAR|nr:magnesium transporter NIPA-domain-containing protein [Crepidotus variabilis]